MSEPSSSSGAPASEKNMVTDPLTGEQMSKNAYKKLERQRKNCVVLLLLLVGLPVCLSVCLQER